MKKINSTHFLKLLFLCSISLQLGLPQTSGAVIFDLNGSAVQVTRKPEIELHIYERGISVSLGALRSFLHETSRELLSPGTEALDQALKRIEEYLKAEEPSLGRTSPEVDFYPAGGEAYGVTERELETDLKQVLQAIDENFSKLKTAKKMLPSFLELFCNCLDIQGKAPLDSFGGRQSPLHRIYGADSPSARRPDGFRPISMSVSRSSSPNLYLSLCPAEN